MRNRNPPVPLLVRNLSWLYNDTCERASSAPLGERAWIYDYDRLDHLYRLVIVLGVNGFDLP